ncbi:MAG: C39 family peptidase, partial [bacterium]
MRSALLIATSLIAVLPPLSDAADYSLVAVPYHSQIAEGNPAVPNNWCSVACINMLFDYYEDVPGPPFCQVEIAMVVNTDDAAGSLAWQGTQASDARRGCHFSVLSQSINGGLFGYGWRSTGFSAVDTTWHWSVSTLKNLLDLGYPVIIHSVPGPLDSLYQQDGSPFTEATDTTETGHSRVLIGYNDTLAVPVFIMHDPWSPDSVPIGAFVWCTQSYFWNTVWPPGSGLLFAAPWEISVTHPDTLDMNDTVKVKAKVHYTGPPPLTGHFPLSETPVVRLVLPPGLSFSSGDSSLHRLSGINLSGDIDSTEWYILTGESASEDTFLLLARGILSSSSVSYPAGYRDSIGGYGVSPFVVSDISPPVVDV